MSNALPTVVDHSELDAALPPQDLLAEQSVLGGMMLSPDVVGEVCEVLSARDFYRQPHAAVFQAVVDLYGRGEPTDAIVVAAELERRGELARVGGAPYLHTQLATVPTAANAGYYARIVAEKAQLRRLVQAGQRIVQFGYAGAQMSASAEEVLDQAQAALDSVADDDPSTSGFTSFSAMRAECMSVLDDVQAGRVEPGLSTGFQDLDEVTNGWQPGQLIVIAGRPGMGKSTLAVDMARHASVREGQTTAIFSLEMSRHELWQRVHSAEAKVRLKAMKTPGALQPDDYDRLAKAGDRIDNGGQMIVDDTPNITVTQIRAKARRIKARHGLGLLVVDYLQLMTSGRRAESRQVEVAEFSRQLKILAKELEVPLVVISQLNRASEQRQDKRPMLADLRESGSIEQDSDVVILIHRPEVYEDPCPRAGEADLILAKHRGGPTTTITVAQQLHYSRFVDLAAPTPPQP